MDQLCKRIDSYYDNMVSTLETLVTVSYTHLCSLIC